MQNNQYELKANLFRRQIGVAHQMRPDVITILYKAKDIGLIKNFRIVNDDEMHQEGEYISDQKLILLRESVFKAANIQGTTLDYVRQRARMTVVHEISHALSDHRGILNRDLSAVIKPYEIKLKKAESEAKNLAAAILAPFLLFPASADLITAQEISYAFDISMQAAEIRIENFMKRNNLKTERGRELPDFVKEYLREAKSKGYKPRTLFDDD